MGIGRKFKMQKKYLAFFAIVPALAATAFISAPCPVCHGTGVVSSTGMANVEVTNVKLVEQTRFMAGCDTFRVYQYEITVDFANHSTTDAAGWVSFVMTAKSSSKVLDTQYGVADVPANSTVQSTFTAYFQISVTVDMPESTMVAVKILDGNVADKACNGTGSVPLNSWLLTHNLKDSYLETQRVAKPAIPPLWVETEGQAGIDY